MNDDPSEKDLIKYVAFLRGINVGGNTLIKMEDLRKAFESLGFQKVKTVLASGNVIFEAAGDDTTLLARKIAILLQEIFGREVLVIVRSIGDLRELKVRQPFSDIQEAHKTRLFATFISGNTEHRDISGLSMPKEFQILSASNGIICSVLYERPGVGAVHLMGAIEKEFGPKVTTRTWNTILRILKASEK